MALDPGFGYRVKAEVTDIKGKCNAGHKVGDSFEISCHNPAGLCGVFYRNVQIVATLSQLSWSDLRERICSEMLWKCRH